MKTTLFVLLALGVLITGCNEKVSPDLDNVSGVTSGDAAPPAEFIFEVTNTASPLLNYKLHRTGPLNAIGKLKDCKISSLSPFQSSTFIAENSTVSDHDSKTYDISCFYETEEQNLYYNGVDFSINSSKNTCEYVGYSPYSFYQWQPGHSSGSLTLVTGDEFGCANSGVSDVSGTIACGQAVDDSVGVGSRKSFLFNEDNLCYYDHSIGLGEGPNCDDGDITVNTVICIENVCDTGNKIFKKCGGKPVNCIEGPIKKEGLLAKYTRGTISTRTEQGKDYSQKYSLDGGFDGGFTSNLNIVNYRRDLANPNINFTNHTTVGADTYPSRFRSVANSTYQNKYDPRLIDRYSANKLWDNTTDAATFTTMNIMNGASIVRRVYPQAAEPFIGAAGFRTNPHYTFTCMDAAFEIRARIRVVVREWDRMHPADLTPFTLITDIADSNSDASRQDNSFTELDGDNDGFSGFNDVPDWDDIILMTRSGGALVPSTTLWEPSTGFFNQNGFLNESLKIE